MVRDFVDHPNRATGHLLGDAENDLECLATTPFRGDRSPPMVRRSPDPLEYEGRRCPLSGDASARTLVSSPRRLADNGGDARKCLDALKLPHHGSKINVSWDLLQPVGCPRLLCSTNGQIVHHPEP